MTRAIKWAAFPLTVQRFSWIFCHLLSQLWLFCLGSQPRCDRSCRLPLYPESLARGGQTSKLKLPLCRDELKSSWRNLMFWQSRRAAQTDVLSLPASSAALLKHTNTHTYTSTDCFLALVYSALVPYHSWRVAVSTPQALTLSWLLCKSARLKGKVSQAAPTAPANVARQMRTPCSHQSGLEENTFLILLYLFRPTSQSQII